MPLIVVHVHPLIDLSELEALMDTITDLLAKAQKLVSDLEAIPPARAPLATQADLDALGVSLDAAATTVAALAAAQV